MDCRNCLHAHLHVSYCGAPLRFKDGFPQECACTFASSLSQVGKPKLDPQLIEAWDNEARRAAAHEAAQRKLNQFVQAAEGRKELITEDAVSALKALIKAAEDKTAAPELVVFNLEQLSDFCYKFGPQGCGAVRQLWLDFQVYSDIVREFVLHQSPLVIDAEGELLIAGVRILHEDDQLVPDLVTLTGDA